MSHACNLVAVVYYCAMLCILTIGHHHVMLLYCQHGNKCGLDIQVTRYFILLFDVLEAL